MVIINTYKTKAISQIKNFLIFIICLLFIFGLLFFSKEIGKGIEKGLELSFSVIIPSMYVFMILGNIISNSKLSLYMAKPFSLISKYIFRLDPSLFSVFIISLIGGYPVASKIISDKVKNGEISVSTGSYMLNFCVNTSPSFLIASLSIPIYKTTTYGIIIYLSQILACLIIAFISSRKLSLQKTNTATKREDISALFISSVNNATKSMVIICSFIVLFCALFVFIDLLPLQNELLIYIKGMLEVTSGCQMVSVSNTMLSILQISFFTSLGGFCVILQISALIKDSGIPLLPFIKVRLIYTFLSVALTYLGVILLAPSVDCINSYPQAVDTHLYSTSPISSILFIGLGVMLLFTLLEYKFHGRKTCQQSQNMLQ